MSMRNGFGRFGLLLFVAMLLGMPTAHAQSIEDRCNANWKDNATYRTCVEQLTVKEGKAIPATGICSAKTCIYKLACGASQHKICNGGGYRLEYKDDENGFSDIFITDPNGRTSKFGETGSVGIENVSGPLLKSTLRHAGNDMVLEVPR
jgi:hypothetical protein